jgi:D-lactate dehydrogenase
MWAGDLPAGGHRRPRGGAPSADAQAVFFASCIGSMFGPSASGTGAGPAFLQLCRRAGVEVALPRDLPDLCCGTPWKSKGMTGGYAVMKERLLPALWEASRGGELPVVCDASSCTEGLQELLAAPPTGATPGYDGLVVRDAVSFVLDIVLPRLQVRSRLASLTVHPTCSSTRMGTSDGLVALAGAIADEVRVPVDWGCCAFAGDRGLLHPELTASATRREAATVMAAPSEAYASSNRTCEIGMSRATGQEFQHLIELLEQATR